MCGGSCSLKGGYRIANKRHYFKKNINKSLKKRSKNLKIRSKSLKVRSKSLKKRGGGYGSGGSSLGSYIKPYKKRVGHKYPEGH